MAIDLNTIAAGVGGFFIGNRAADSQLGYSVSSAGDVNGDGFDDMIVGAYNADGPASSRVDGGEAFVIFGKAGGFPAEVAVADIVAGNGGFVIYGADAGDFLGRSVSTAGDINGDGLADIVVGATGGDGSVNASSSAGDVYVILGRRTGFGPAIDVTSVAAGGGGFVIHGLEAGDRSGISVSDAGDINGDGFDDLIIGADMADGPGNARSSAGESYVVFGHAGGFPSEIDLAAVAAGNGGFVIHGATGGDRSGRSVASAGDVNGDGLDDLVVGAYRANSGYLTTGQSYIVLGRTSGFGPSIDLAAIQPGDGTLVLPADAEAGWSVASAGDVNGDGFDDVLVGAPRDEFYASPIGSRGSAYLYMGGANGPTTGTTFIGEAGGAEEGIVQRYGDVAGWSVASAGDVNGDGLDDLLIGARLADGPGDALTSAGETYVVFGRRDGFGSSVQLADIAAGNGGFVIHGRFNVEASGTSVSSAGDINGDGFDDLLVGAPGKGWNFYPPYSQTGAMYVVFGSATIDGSTDHVTHPGTDVSETLTGDSTANVMLGGRGDDTLLGAGGEDVLRGGEGDDVLTIADAGFLRVVGGTGHDTLAFSDVVTMTDADFRRVEGMEGIRLGNSFAHLTLGPIAERAFDGTAADGFRLAIDGSLAQSVSVIIDASAFDGNLTINLENNTQFTTLEGGNGDDSILGGAGFDTLTGGRGADFISGGGRADIIFATHDDGNDTISGGVGFDILDYSAVLGPVQINQLAGTTTGSAGNDVLLDVIEQIGGTNFDDVLSGGHGINVLDGNGGNDRFFGNNGDDLLRGGAGDDTFHFSTSDGNDTLIGGDGFDVLDYSSLQGVVQVNQLDGTTNGTADNDVLGDVFEMVIGTAFGDVLSGGHGINSLKGGGGNDQIFANNGDDYVSGGTGNDTIALGVGNDVLDFRNGENVDTITDFTAGGTDDRIDLRFYSGLGITTFVDLEASGRLSTVSGHAELSLDGGDRIIFQNVASHTLLTAADFVLA